MGAEQRIKLEMDVFKLKRDRKNALFPAIIILVITISHFVFKNSPCYSENLNKSAGYPPTFSCKSSAEIREIQEAFAKSNGGRIKPESVAINPCTGIVIYVDMPLGDIGGPITSRKVARQFAKEVLSNNRRWFGLDKIGENFDLKDIPEFDRAPAELAGLRDSANTNEYSFTVEMQPALEGVALDHTFFTLGKFWTFENVVTVMTGEDSGPHVYISRWGYYPQLTNLKEAMPLSPKISQEDALRILKNYKLSIDLPSKVKQVKTINLNSDVFSFYFEGIVILPHYVTRFYGPLEFRLAYKIAVEDFFSKKTVLYGYVDAITGEVIKVIGRGI